MKSILLPNEMIEHIFLFCDDITLIELQKSIYFEDFHKKIGIILETRVIHYWNKIQISYIASLMKPIMETHQKNLFFGGISTINDRSTSIIISERRKFMLEWHDSDAKLSSEMLNMNIQDVILYLKREKERLLKKYSNVKDLEGRPYFLNRFLMLSVREMYHIYLPPPNN